LKNAPPPLGKKIHFSDSGLKIPTPKFIFSWVFIVVYLLWRGHLARE
jgi:hypothetical protein